MLDSVEDRRNPWGTPWVRDQNVVQFSLSDPFWNLSSRKQWRYRKVVPPPQSPSLKGGLEEHNDQLHQKSLQEIQNNPQGCSPSHTHISKGTRRVSIPKPGLKRNLNQPDHTDVSREVSPTCSAAASSGCISSLPGSGRGGCVVVLALLGLAISIDHSDESDSDGLLLGGLALAISHSSKLKRPDESLSPPIPV